MKNILLIAFLFLTSCSKTDLEIRHTTTKIIVNTHKTPLSINIMIDDTMYKSLVDYQSDSPYVTIELLDGKHVIKDLVLIYEDKSFERILKRVVYFSTPKENVIVIAPK